MTKWIIQAALALGLVGMVAVGCNRHTASNGEKKLKFAFVTNNASDFWKLAANGVKKYEKESGVQVDIKMPPSGTVEEQKQILENLVSQGYDGIAVSVIAPDDEIDAINAACAKTKVICQDSDAPKSKRLCYIGTNNYEAGKKLGEQIVKLLPNGGKMAVFVGMFSADNASQRLKGIEDVIKGHNIEIVAKKEDNKDPVKAQSNVDDVIVSQPDVNLLVGLWSYNGPAISDAIERAGKKGKLLAAVFDQEDGTLDGIQKGVIACTVVQKPFQFGYLSSKMLHDLVTKGDSVIPASKMVDTGVEVIDAKNIAKYREEMKAMKQ